MPRHPEMGAHIDVPPAQPHLLDAASESLPETDSAVNDLARPTDAPAVPGLAELDFSGLSDEVHPDITRPASASEVTLSMGGGTEPPDPNRAASDADGTAGEPEGPEHGAGSPPDQPPPIDNEPPIGGEGGDSDDGGEGFSDEQLRGLFEESVGDLPPQEYQTVVGQLETFAAGGHRVELPTHYHEEDGTPVDEVRGYGRSVSPDALAAEGVPYDWVSVGVLEPNGEEPYSVGVTAGRGVLNTVEMPVGDDGESLPMAVEGQEMKSVGFAASGPDETAWRMITYSTLRTVTPLARTIENGIAFTAIAPVLDENAPPMTLEEFRGIMRAVERADEFPEDPASIVLRATIGANDAPPNPDMSGPEGAPFTDMSQAARGTFLREADTYARSGLTGPGVPGITQHLHPIPKDISRQYGFTGTVMARVDEAPDTGYYRAGITVQDVVEIDVPDGSGGTMTVPGAREEYLGVYSQRGRLQGYPNSTSPDEAAGDGLHLQYIGHTTYRVPGSHMLDHRVEPDIDYGRARNLLAALHDALARNNAAEQ